MRRLHRDLPFLLLIPGAAVALEFVAPSLGRGVDLAFYEAAVQIAPVLYLAMLVELAASHSYFGEWRKRLKDVEESNQVAWKALRGRTDNEAAELGEVVRATRRELVSLHKDVRTARFAVVITVVAYSTSALAGVAPGLIVLACGKSWTWALVLVAGSIVATFVILLLTFLDRFGVSPAPRAVLGDAPVEKGRQRDEDQ